MGLALLAHAHLPLKFWAEAFISAVHIINVLPSPIIHGDTPHHKLFHTTPNYAHFKVFGCACYPNLRPYNTRKFAFRSQCCLFLGYSLHRAGYICLTADGKTIISRNVIFNESHFPYNAQSLPFAVSSGNILPTVSSNPSLTIVPFHPSPAAPPDVPPAVSPAGPPTDISASSAPLPVSPTTNVHPMVTRAKVGTHKPKVYFSSLPNIPHIPSSVKTALASPLWSIAMQEEYTALLSNNTWTLTTLPPNASLVGCKWVFKTKLHADGSFHRCKARLVAKGFHQTHGLDYAETFSPVVRHTTIRLVLAHAVTSGWPVRQVDVNNAFLNGDLSECVYMQQPPGFVSANPHLVCRLHKAIYGLKQAPRSWFLKLSNTLHSLGFTPIKSDTSLFVRFTPSHTLLVLVYVDDILITGSSPSAITTLISRLHSCFALKDLGNLHHFLGIQVTRTSTGDMHLSQSQYIRELLHKTTMVSSNPQPTPMISTVRLQHNSSMAFHDPTLYRSVVGTLQYLLVTRPELSYSVNKVAQFMHAPQNHHWQAVKRILRYLAGTVHHGLLLHRTSTSHVLAFADADWAADLDDRKSTTGFCVYLGSNLIAWSTHKQKCVSRSSTEAEYRAIAAVMAELLWLRSLLHELHIPTSIPRIYSDNLGAVLLSANPVMHSKSKHFGLDLHFVRDNVQTKQVQLFHIPARYQVADMLTKPVSGVSFLRVRNKLKVVPASTISLRGDVKCITE